jgi:hypothetical protein
MKFQVLIGDPDIKDFTHGNIVDIHTSEDGLIIERKGREYYMRGESVEIFDDILDLTGFVSHKKLIDRDEDFTEQDIEMLNKGILPPNRFTYMSFRQITK